MGITWGVWVSPKAQDRASKVCTALGALLAILGLSAIYGLWQVDVDAAKVREHEMYEQRVKDGSILANDHKVFDYSSENSGRH